MMATTSLWYIKGRRSDLIAYVENPGKTVSKGTEDFFNVFSYIQNPQETADGSFVTAIGCLKQTASGHLRPALPGIRPALSLSMAARPPAVPSGWTSKAESPSATMSVRRMGGKR